METSRFLYHTMFLVRFKISIRIRTGAVCSFNPLRILPLMLSVPHVLCVLILCRRFCTYCRDIVSAVFRVWVLVQSGMLSCGSTVDTDCHCLFRMLDFALCQLWSVHRSSLVWHLFCLYVRILYDNNFLGLNWLLMFWSGSFKGRFSI